MKKIAISKAEAKQIILDRQFNFPLTNNELNSTLKVIEHLGYIQIDTIAVIQRAHHHIFWSRNTDYQTSHIDQLIQNKSVFEYWSHAASYLPMKDFRYSLPKKNALKAGKEKHWHQKNKTLMNEVKRRIQTEGPLMAKDFKSEGANSSAWKSAPYKQALEMLFMEGDLMISERRNFHKVYDLTERVLPNSVDTSTPTDTEYAKYLTRRYLNNQGIAQLPEIGFLLKKNIKLILQETLHNMVEDGELSIIEIEGESYYTLTSTIDNLGNHKHSLKVKILSPFDNFLIQRQRIKALFEYDYLLECYLPQSKRKYGYFTLPILWHDNLVARIDCKVDRKKGILNVISLHLEENMNDQNAFHIDLMEELERFKVFNGCQEIVFLDKIN
ncbi:winged helix-turn-helix domain-containing protein [Flammeovirga sp. SJP92]|uniref:winged helix-turn-helix domain-containing protein n=1 Tax=Flammeovirga sp. SJP92 TaxID=1775430 RepID=UPI000786B9B8|nr:crosslink repair DNA glycosylase YcaQ family protein [Flammeovirga sp. SJP92]KXX70424.1 hypothetical protein AVL50_08685 [Flammeovirga sp. SJP92]